MTRDLCQELSCHKTSGTSELSGEMWTQMMMLGALMVTGTQASPKERLKVKYKIKKSNNNGEQLEKQKVTLGVQVYKMKCTIVSNGDIYIYWDFLSLLQSTKNRDNCSLEMFYLSRKRALLI